MALMRIAIATGRHYNPHETQINFHLRTLFGGNTLVLAQKACEPDPNGRASHVWGDTAGASSLGRIIQKTRSFLAHRTVNVPQGITRARIQSFLRAEGAQAVLAEFGTTALRMAPVAVEMGLPVFAYFRGADASLQLREPFRPEAYRRLMPHLHGVFSVSQFLLDNLASHGIRHPESHVIPSGVDTDLFRPGKKRPGSFVFVGRFVDKKRPDITLRAFAAVARQRRDLKLVMIGDGSLLPKCKALADTLGLEGRVEFLGRQPHDVVRAHLAESEVFVQHSVTTRNGNTEGLPTSIQEAMASGLAIISTRHAGIPEAVEEGQTGHLVDEGDDAGFAAAIERISASSDIAAEMGARARSVAVERFDNRRLVARLEDIVTKLSRVS